MRFWIVAALLVLACPAQLQSQESGKVSYEGQKVGVVEVVANPKISVDPYRSLIQLKSGDLYSNPSIQNTTSAPKQPRRFSQLKLDANRKPPRLHVTCTM